MPRPLKRGILGARTIILFIDIDKFAFTFGLNFYESDVILNSSESPMFSMNRNQEVELLHYRLGLVLRGPDLVIFYCNFMQ